MPSILMLTALLLSWEEDGRGGGGGLIKNIKLQMGGCLLEGGG